jgi:hypothetical protein
MQADSRPPTYFLSASRRYIGAAWKVEGIAEAVAKLPPDQLARFRRWFTEFEEAAHSTPLRLNSVASPAARLLI